MDLIQLLRGEIRRSLHGPAWHGPALLEALAEVRVSDALKRPLPEAHSIAELAFHSLAWVEEVTRRLSGAAPALPARGDWPEATELDDAAWAGVQDAVALASEKLDRALAEFPEERLHDKVGDAEQLSSVVTYWVMLHGLAQHNAYHGGQVALLKRGLGAR